MLGIYNNLLQRLQALVYSPILLQSIHMEVSTAPFALLSTTPWAMLFALCIVLSTLSICQVSKLVPSKIYLIEDRKTELLMRAVKMLVDSKVRDFYWINPQS